MSDDKKVETPEKVVEAKAPALTLDDVQTIVDETVKTVIKDYKPEPHASTKFFVNMVTDKETDRFKRTGDKEEKIGFGHMLALAALAKRNPTKAMQLADKLAHDDNYRYAKALNAGTFDAGGALIQEEILDEIIELLRPLSVVRASGVRTISLESGIAGINRISGGATANWIGEERQNPESQQILDRVRMSAKKLAVLVPMSNEVLNFTNDTIFRLAQEDALMTLATKEDQTFLRGTGSDFEPKGLLNLAGFTATATAVAPKIPTVAEIEADLDLLEGALADADVPLTNKVWFFAPRTKRFVRTVREGAGGNIGFEEIKQGMLRDWPFFETNNIPINLGGGSDESEIYCVNTRDIIIGDAGTMRIDVSNEASFVDSNSNTQSAFQNDLSLLRVIRETDIITRHPEAVATLTAVRWGAP